MQTQSVQLFHTGELIGLLMRNPEIVSESNFGYIEGKTVLSENRHRKDFRYQESLEKLRVQAHYHLPLDNDFLLRENLESKSENQDFQEL